MKSELQKGWMPGDNLCSLLPNCWVQLEGQQGFIGEGWKELHPVRRAGIDQPGEGSRVSCGTSQCLQELRMEGQDPGDGFKLTAGKF